MLRTFAIGVLTLAVAAQSFAQELCLPKNSEFAATLAQAGDPVYSFGITLHADDGIVRSVAEGNVYAYGEQDGDTLFGPYVIIRTIVSYRFQGKSIDNSTYVLYSNVNPSPNLRTGAPVAKNEPIGTMANRQLKFASTSDYVLVNYSDDDKIFPVLFMNNRLKPVQDPAVPGIFFYNPEWLVQNQMDAFAYESIDPPDFFERDGSHFDQTQKGIVVDIIHRIRFYFELKSQPEIVTDVQLKELQLIASSTRSPILLKCPKYYRLQVGDRSVSLLIAQGLDETLSFFSSRTSRIYLYARTIGLLPSFRGPVLLVNDITALSLEEMYGH